MKNLFFRLFTALLVLAPPACALADIRVDSGTILNFSQDDRAGYGKKNYMPATQFLGVDADKLADGNLSLHLYGWGRLDLKEKSYNDDYTAASLTYGFLQYRFNEANAQLRAGRIFIREGIVNEQVDGLSARTDLPFGFGISAFGGATVHTVSAGGETNDGKGNGIYGGRLNFRSKGMLELGISGLYETSVASLDIPGNQALATGGFYGERRLVGGDIWLSPHPMVELLGHSSYNRETKGIAEHSYLLNLKPLKDLVLTGEYNEYRERSLFYSSLLFAKLASSLDEGSRSLGGRASYKLREDLELAADYRYYTRDIGNAARFGGDLRFWLLEDQSLRMGVSYHYLRSGPDFAVIPSSGASGSYHEIRAYGMRDTKSIFFALDGLGYFFRDTINDRKTAWECVGSLGYHLTPELALSGDMSYGENPQFAGELKGLIRLTFNGSLLKGGTK